jgi:hypothetical protein
VEVFCENPGIFLGTLGPKNEDREFINVWLIGLDSCRRVLVFVDLAMQ